MSANNALTQSVHQTAAPELCKSTTLGRSRRQALTLFSRVRISSRQIDSKQALANLAFLGFWDLLPANFGSEMLPKTLKHFSLKLKCLPLYQLLTKNFTQKAEMLRCHFDPQVVSHSLLSLAWKSILAKPETTPETFQGVSRNAETLALQMNHLREFPLETIKKYL
jgi:hypothetical protein